MKFETLFKLIIAGLVALVAWGIFGQAIIMAGASGNYLPSRPVIDAHFPRWDACRTYDIGGVDPTDGISCGGQSQETKTRKVSIEDNPAPLVVTVETIPTQTPTVTDNPVVTPPVVTDEPTQEPTAGPTETVNKKRCNNGEGNGGEGCSPAKSPNANNDENDTTPKEDKRKN